MTGAPRFLGVAEKEGVRLASGATLPFLRCSCAYVGRSEGWTDLVEDFQTDWEFTQDPRWRRIIDQGVLWFGRRP